MVQSEKERSLCRVFFDEVALMPQAGTLAGRPALIVFIIS